MLTVSTAENTSQSHATADRFSTYGLDREETYLEDVHINVSWGKEVHVARGKGPSRSIFLEEFADLSSRTFPFDKLHLLIIAGFEIDREKRRLNG